MAKEIFRIAYPAASSEKKNWTKNYGMNAYYSGKHWSIRKKDAEYWHWLTLSAMNEQGIRRNPFNSPVKISFYWNDRMDIDNHAIMGKMIVDAMKGRVIKDDNRRFLKGVSHYFHDEDYILVVVEEVRVSDG
nr:MAG TPA: crossover junction endodeoxyribonuclease [Caudoviricetes sp.]